MIPGIRYVKSGSSPQADRFDSCWRKVQHHISRVYIRALCNGNTALKREKARERQRSRHPTEKTLWRFKSARPFHAS